MQQSRVFAMAREQLAGNASHSQQCGCLLAGEVAGASVARAESGAPPSFGALVDGPVDGPAHEPVGAARTAVGNAAVPLHGDPDDPGGDGDGAPRHGAAGWVAVAVARAAGPVARDEPVARDGTARGLAVAHLAPKRASVLLFVATAHDRAIAPGRLGRRDFAAVAEQAAEAVAATGRGGSATVDLRLVCRSSFWSRQEGKQEGQVAQDRSGNDG